MNQATTHLVRSGGSHSVVANFNHLMEDSHATDLSY